MQKTKAKLPVLVIVVMVIVACFLRFFQLLRYTEDSVVLAGGGTKLSYFIYAGITAMLAGCVWYGFKSDKGCRSAVAGSADKRLALFSAIGAIGLFSDFLNQSYNCYAYIDNTRYIEYSYIIVVAFSGVLALVSSFYLFMLFIAANGTRLDFKRLGWLNFSPFGWAFLKLLSIATMFISAENGIEASCEIMFLVSFVLVWFAYLLSMEGNHRQTDIIFTASSIFCFCMALMLCAPRAMMLIAAGEIYHIELEYVCYIALAAFSLSLAVRREQI